MSDIYKAKASREARAALSHRQGASRSTEQMAEAAIRRYLAATESHTSHSAEHDDQSDSAAEDGTRV